MNIIHEFKVKPNIKLIKEFRVWCLLRKNDLKIIKYILKNYNIPLSKHKIARELDIEYLDLAATIRLKPNLYFTKRISNRIINLNQDMFILKETLLLTVGDWRG